MTDLTARKEAVDALKIQNAVTSLASRFDTRLVMQVLREWLDYMDRQATHSGPRCGHCYIVVCSVHKRIIEQCDCTSAWKERTDVPCPGGCWQ